MRSHTNEIAVLVDIRAISQLLRVSDKTARRFARHADFPRPVRIRGCLRWWKSEVLEYLRQATPEDTAVACQP